MKTKIIPLICGIFLTLDGALSIYFGNSCLDFCYNNYPIGNVVRIIRLFIGLYLIYYSYNKCK